MKRPRGPRPITEFVIEVGEEPGGIAGICERIEHHFERRKLGAVPPEIDLETADIKAATPRSECLVGECQGLVPGFKPSTGALEIDRPRPGCEGAIPGSACFCAGQREEHRLGNTGFRRDPSRGGITEARGLRRGGNRRRRKRQRCDQGEGKATYG